MLKLCIAFVLILAGCGLTPEQQAKQAAQKAAEQEARDRADDAKCRQFGAQPGSQFYVTCRAIIVDNGDAGGLTELSQKGQAAATAVTITNHH